MSISTYINKLMKDHNLNYDELSKKLNISTVSARKISNQHQGFLTINMLEKISKYTDEKKSHILFQCLADRETSRICDEATLMHLCNKYCQNYGVDLHTKITAHTFVGQYYKKRSMNSLTFVDGLKNLEIEYYNQYFGKVEPYNYSRILFDSHFISRSAFYSNILYYGIQKVQTISSVNVVNYDIIVADEKDYYSLFPYLPQKPGININIVLQHIPDNLKYDNLVTIDHEDITYFVDLCQATTESLIDCETEELPAELWSAVLESINVLLPYCNYDEIFKTVVLDKDINFFLNDEEKELNEKEILEIYLQRKIRQFKTVTNETETINSLLCYESYSALLRIICSTLLMKKIYFKDLKSILDFLNPLISYLDLIGQKTPNAPILF